MDSVSANRPHLGLVGTSNNTNIATINNNWSNTNNNRIETSDNVIKYCDLKKHRRRIRDSERHRRFFARETLQQRQARQELDALRHRIAYHSGKHKKR
jgi:uncharacterized membrane-anchored protein